MYCTNCGRERAGDALVCANCGQHVQLFESGDVPNHLIWSIFSTICCCLPLGIVALIYSAQVNSKLAAYDVHGAERASNLAQRWIFVTFVAGILTWGFVTYRLLSR